MLRLIKSLLKQLRAPSTPDTEAEDTWHPCRAGKPTPNAGDADDTICPWDTPPWEGAKRERKLSR
jgi:hypothetical protein